MGNGLPEVCRICKKFKLPHLGKFTVVGHGKRAWTCLSCLDQPTYKHGNPKKRETPPEAIVKGVLLGSGHFFVQEYPKLEPFVYDFAIPRLRMLIEVDSKSYHSYPRQKSRDKAKTKLAEDEGWHLVRVQYPGDLEGVVAKEITDREAALGIF